MKRNVLKEAMEGMRNELYHLRGSMCKYARGEKYALVSSLCPGLYMSLL